MLRGGSTFGTTSGGSAVGGANGSAAPLVPALKRTHSTSHISSSASNPLSLTSLPAASSASGILTHNQHQPIIQGQSATTTTQFRAMQHSSSLPITPPKASALPAPKLTIDYLVHQPNVHWGFVEKLDVSLKWSMHLLILLDTTLFLFAPRQDPYADPAIETMSLGLGSEIRLTAESPQNPAASASNPSSSTSSPAIIFTVSSTFVGTAQVEWDMKVVSSQDMNGGSGSGDRNLPSNGTDISGGGGGTEGGLLTVKVNKDTATWVERIRVALQLGKSRAREQVMRRANGQLNLEKALQSQSARLNYPCPTVSSSVAALKAQEEDMIRGMRKAPSSPELKKKSSASSLRKVGLQQAESDFRSVSPTLPTTSTSALQTSTAAAHQITRVRSESNLIPSASSPKPLPKTSSVPRLKGPVKSALRRTPSNEGIYINQQQQNTSSRTPSPPLQTKEPVQVMSDGPRRSRKPSFSSGGGSIFNPLRLRSRSQSNPPPSPAVSLPTTPNPPTLTPTPQSTSPIPTSVRRPSGPPVTPTGSTAQPPTPSSDYFSPTRPIQSPVNGAPTATMGLFAPAVIQISRSNSVASMSDGGADAPPMPPPRRGSSSASSTTSIASAISIAEMLAAPATTATTSSTSYMSSPSLHTIEERDGVTTSSSSIYSAVTATSPSNPTFPSTPPLSRSRRLGSFDASMSSSQASTAASSAASSPIKKPSLTPLNLTSPTATSSPKSNLLTSTSSSSSSTATATTTAPTTTTNGSILLTRTKSRELLWRVRSLDPIPQQQQHQQNNIAATASSSLASRDSNEGIASPNVFAMQNPFKEERQQLYHFAEAGGGVSMSQQQLLQQQQQIQYLQPPAVGGGGGGGFSLFKGKLGKKLSSVLLK